MGPVVIPATLSVMRDHITFGKRHAAILFGSLAALVVVAATPQLLGDRVSAS